MVKPTVLSHIPIPKISGLLNLKVSQGVPKTLISISLCLFVLFNDRAADGRKHSAKMRARNFEKDAFLQCALFSCARSTFLKNRVSNNMHCWSIQWVFHLIFVNSHFDVFLTPKWRAQTKKRARNLALASKFRTPKTSQRGQFRHQREPKKGVHSGFWVTQGHQC